MNAELISSWIYKKGELTRQKMDDWIMGAAVVLAALLTFTVAWPLTSTHLPFTGKINKFLLLLVFFGIALLLYYILKLFSGSIFAVYSVVAGIKEEEIIFTSYKITSTRKTWVLTDDIKKLTAVQLRTKKNSALVFKGTSTSPGKTPVQYSITIPVPVGERRNAEKVYDYFKALLP